MKFKEENKVVYCKDGSYNKKYDNEDFYYKKEYDNDGVYYNHAKYILYWKGYLIHREDGPAIEGTDGFKEWWLNGIEYLEQEYLKIINLKKKNRTLDEI